MFWSFVELPEAGHYGLVAVSLRALTGVVGIRVVAGCTGVVMEVEVTRVSCN